MTSLAAAGAPPAGDLLFAPLTILTGEGEPLTGGALAVQGGRIAGVGPEAAVAARHPGLARVDATGYTAFPGLVNAHTHAAMGFFRGLGHGHTDMIETFLFPAEKALTPELLEPLSYSYLLSGLRSGVTCFGDHYYFVGGVAKALDRLGLRGVVGETVADLGGAFPGRTGWELWQNTIESWPHSARITPAVAPHAADTVSSALLKELGLFARKRDLPIHLHLAQTSGERQRVVKREGCTPVAYAERYGVLTPKTLAVHLVAIDATDVRLLVKTGVTAGLCPASQIIYEKLAPLDLLLDAGVPLALGTDCAASNDTADLLAEMRLTALLAKDRGVREDKRSPAAVLAMGSLNGARAFGLGKETGTLAAGKAADVVFLKDDLATRPSPRPDVNLVFSAGSRQVRHVMVDGRFVLYHGDPTLASEADLTAAYDAAVAEIKKRLRA